MKGNKKPPLPFTLQQGKRGFINSEKAFENENGIHIDSGNYGFMRAAFVFPPQSFSQQQPQFASSRFKIPSMRDFWLSGAMFKAV